MKSDQIIKLVLTELYRATKLYGPFPSKMHGLAVIQEEVDELWDAVRRKEGAQGECVQVAAMAVRFLMDCCDA